MAAGNHTLFSGIRGSIARQIVIRQRYGKTIVSAFPMFNKKRKRTPAQQQMNQLFAHAHAYAKDILKNPEERDKAQVRLNVQRNRVYNALISEYFRLFREAQAAAEAEDGSEK
jgi:hypothetical protein